MKRMLVVCIAVLLALAAALSFRTPALADDPTETPTPTETPSPTPTLTPSMTFTPSTTPSPTPTLNPGVTWVDTGVSIGTYELNEISALLISDPPDGISGPAVYAATALDAKTGGGWYISLAHLHDVDAPYDDWNAEGDADWLGSVLCTGADPSYTCEYPDFSDDFLSSSTSGLLFPWQGGTWALYGISGVHEDNCEPGCVLPNHKAVDFVGADNWGPDSMPPYVYAVAGGTVNWKCEGEHNAGIRVQSKEDLAFVYFHLLPGQAKLAVGTVLSRGENIGMLAHGPFDDTGVGCGYASQGENQYHLHFEFVPDGDYFEIGGCVLDIPTGQFLCGTQTIHPNEHILNNGGSSPLPTVTPGGPTVTPGPGDGGTEGGEHIWNGLISTITTWINSVVSTVMPVHEDWGLVDYVDNIGDFLQDFAWLLAASDLFWILPTMLVLGLIGTLEAVRVVYALIRLTGGIIDAIPLLG